MSPYIPNVDLYELLIVDEQDKQKFVTELISHDLGEVEFHEEPEGIKLIFVIKRLVIIAENRKNKVKILI